MAETNSNPVLFKAALPSITMPSRFASGLLGLTLIAAPQATASVLFTQSGEDLLIHISQPISFTSSGDFDPFGISGLVFCNVFSQPGPADPASGFLELTPALMTLDGETPLFSGVTTGGDITGVLSPLDLGLSTVWPTLMELSKDETFTLNAGLFTAKDFFADPAAALPDLPVTTIKFFVETDEDEVIHLAATAVVPEPAPTAAAVGLAFAGFALWRRARSRRL